MSKPTPTTPLREHVERALDDYFNQLGGHKPSNLYRMVIDEIEPPLLAAALRFTGGNQRRAAEILGLDRTTLRKKIRYHQLVDDSKSR